MLIKCSSSFSITGRPVLSITPAVSSELKACAGEMISLKLGLSQYEVNLSSDILNQHYCELRFPKDDPHRLTGLHLLTTYFSTEERTLHAGPVIAVLTDSGSKGRPALGRLEEYFSELFQFTNTHGGLFYLTDPSLLSSKKGFLFNEEKSEWEEGSVPLPDVLYNRIHSRKTDRSGELQKLLLQLEEQSVFSFNSSYLTKGYVHEQLSAVNHLIEYLPATESFTLPGLRNMLEKYHDVYIKHIAGSQGKKLLRLSYFENNILLKQNIGNETVHELFPTFENAAKELSRLKISSNFIIQETVPLLQSDNKALDFRFLCHLVDPDQWRLISATARVSGEGQFVSNVAQGGKLVKPLTVLGESFNKKEAVRIYTIMKELALSACMCLAESSRLTLGELGVDIGVDETGKPWLIEINSKPSKQTYFENNKIRPSVKTLYHFSKSIWEERRP